MNLKKAGTSILVLAIAAIAAGNALPAENKAGTPCPKKVAVTIETVKATNFQEYQVFSGKGQSEIVAINSPVAGVLSELKVSEGSLVDAGQDLAVLNAGLNKEIKQLEADAAKAKKILTARQNWKEKSEKAIQSAAAAYQKALDLLNAKKSQSNVAVKAPVAGIVRLVMAAGSEMAADALLMEITNPRQMLFQIPLAAADKGSLAVGDRFSGATEGPSAEFEAEVSALSDSQVTLRMNNEANQIKDGARFTFKKLKAEHAEVIVIPSAAVQEDSLGNFVYVAEKKKAKKVYVSIVASNTGKTMVEKGLFAGDALIVSGLDCLVDGKKIRIVNEEEMAKALAELKEKEAVQKEKIATEPEVKPETPAKTKKPSFKIGNQFRVGLTFGRFSIKDKNLKDFFGESFKNIPGIEASIHVMYNVDVWASYKALTLENKTTYFENLVKFKMNPVSVGLRYRFPKKSFLEPFVGAGLNFYSYKETIEGESDLADTKDSASGFFFQGGTYLHVKHFRNLQGEVFLKYNSVKKTLAEVLPDGTDQLDLGGLEMGIGVVMRF